MIPPLIHLLVATDHGWHVHCGATPEEHDCVPLVMKSRVTCPGCQQWPQPASRARAAQVLASRTASGETVLTTGLKPLAGGRGQPMNQLELAYHAVLSQSAMVLRHFYEPWPFVLGKSLTFWVDFVVVLWDGSLEFHEVKAGKLSAAGNRLAIYRGDGRAKFLMFCDRYRHLGACKIAMGWKESGCYCWDVREEKAHG